MLLDCRPGKVAPARAARGCGRVSRLCEDSVCTAKDILHTGKQRFIQFDAVVGVLFGVLYEKCEKS